MLNTDLREKDGQSERQSAQLAFAGQVKKGNYLQLYGDNLLSIFDQAVIQLKTSGLHEEVGSLRYVLARMMKEQQDMTRLTSNVARIVSVSIRTVHMHHTITGQTLNELVGKLAELLVELGGDLKATPTAGMKS